MKLKKITESQFSVKSLFIVFFLLLVKRVFYFFVTTFETNLYTSLAFCLQAHITISILHSRSIQQFSFLFCIFIFISFRALFFPFFRGFSYRPLDKPRQRLLTAARCKNLRIDLRPDEDEAPESRLLCGGRSLDQDQNRTRSGQCKLRWDNGTERNGIVGIARRHYHAHHRHRSTVGRKMQMTFQGFDQRAI